MTTTCNPTSPRRQPTGSGSAGSRDQGLDLRATIGGVRQRAPRRLGQWAASALFVIIVVIALVALFQSQSDRVEVLAVRGPVPAGQAIEESDLRPVEVAGVPGAIRADDIDSVVGKHAAAGLVQGQVLTGSALTNATVPGEADRLVAVKLPTGRVPGGLTAGDVVEVIVVPEDGDKGSRQQLQAPTVLSQTARVQSVGRTPDGGRVITVLVAAGEAEQVAAYSSAGQVTIIQAPLSAGR